MFGSFMAKPRVFVSSTYYDLQHIRNSLKSFIESMGFEPVLFESGDIPFRHDLPLDESCYSEISNCHILILIIGGRYGSPASTEGKTPEGDSNNIFLHYNSITKREYETARKRDIPIFIFIEKNVFAEYQTFKANRENATIKFVSIDNTSIFRLLDEILSQKRNNFIKGFEKFDDICSWLRDQWAGLFADFLTRQSGETTLKDLAAQISSLSQVASALKDYTESIMRKMKPEDFQIIISKHEQKLKSSKIAGFLGEELIKHIINNSKKAIDEEKLFDDFAKVKSVEDLVKIVSLPTNIKNDLSNEFKDMANHDIKKIQDLYFSD
jgi:hypothetical protein